MEKVQSLLDTASGVLGFGGDPYATPVGSKIDLATHEHQVVEDWGLILEICDIINNTEDGPKDAMRALRRKLFNSAGKNNQVLNLTLTVLETCAKNCRKPFHLLICDREFASELINKVIQPKLEPPQAVQDRVLKMIQSWAHAFSADPQLQGVAELYMELKKKGVEFPPPSDDDILLVQAIQSSPDSRPSSSASSSSTGPSVRDVQSVSPDKGAVVSPPRRKISKTADQTRKIQAARLVLSGRLSESQTKKLERDLDITERNLQVFSELLSELSPGEEHAEDRELLLGVAASCKEMQNRVMELLEIVENRELTQRLLDVNDTMNNHFLRFERYKNNLGGPAECAPAGPITLRPAAAAAQLTSSEGREAAAAAAADPRLEPEKSKSRAPDMSSLAGSRPGSSEVAALANSNEEEFHEIEAWMKEHGLSLDDIEQSDGMTSDKFERFLAARAEAADKPPPR